MTFVSLETERRPGLATSAGYVAHVVEVAITERSESPAGHSVTTGDSPSLEVDVMTVKQALRDLGLH